MHPGEVIVALASLFMTGLVLYPLARALGRRLEHRTPASAPVFAASSDPRLERIEQAIEAIAVEIERILEAQRFTTRLLAERNPSPAMPSDVSHRA